MNIQYLYYFQTLAACEHYTKAAEELGIAQSSLSHAIRSLEEELGVALFEKQGRGVSLTVHGKQYLPFVENALLLLEDGKRQLRKSSKGVISIGVVSSKRWYIIEKIEQFRNNPRWENCQFSLYENNSEALIHDLKHEKLDFILAATIGPDPEIKMTPLLRENLIVIQPEKHPFIQKNSVTLKELSQIPMILHTHSSGMRRVEDTLFASQHCRPIINGEASEDAVLHHMVSMGMGAALVIDSDNIREPGVTLVPLDEPNNYRYLHLITKKNRYIPPLVESFMDFLQTS